MGQSKIYNFLKANEGVWFNIENITLVCDMSKSQVSKLLQKMFKYPGIYEKLEYKHVREYRGTDLKGNFNIKYFRVEPIEIE